MHRYRKAVGLTIGTHSAKLVEARRRGPSVSLVRSGRVRLSDDPAEALRVLRRFLDEGGWNRAPCLVAVPSEAMFLRRVESPGGRAALREALRGEEESFLDMMPRGAVLDSALLGRRQGRRTALLAVARPDVLDRTLEVAGPLGVDIVDAIPAPVAFHAAVAHRMRRRPRERFLAIQVGWEATEVVSGTARDLFFARRLPIGRSRLPQETGGAATPSKAGMETGTDPSFDEWLTDLEACRKAAGAGPSRRSPGRLLLFGLRPAGPCARRIEERLGLPMEFPEPRPGSSPSTGEEEDGRMMTATGLALAGVGRAPFALSLLPAERREATLLGRQFAPRAAAAAAAALALGLLAGDAGSDRRHLRAELAARRLELERMEQARAETGRAREAAQEVERALAPARAAAVSGRAVSALLDMLGAAKHPDDWITRVAEADAYFEGPHPQAPSVPRPGGPFHFVIEGYTLAEDLSTVRAMIESLRRRPGVASADWLGDDRVREDGLDADGMLDRPLRRFAVEVTLWPR